MKLSAENIIDKAANGNNDEKVVNLTVDKI
jgi:hypothetical protein